MSCSGHRTTVALLAAGAITFAAGSGHAWEPIHRSEPTWCESSVPYGIGQTSTDLGESTTVQEVRRGIEDWTEVACTSLSTSWQGRINNTTAGSRDGVSMIGWVESGWRFPSTAIGVTQPQFGRSCISEADMQMNGVHYTWTTEPGNGGQRVNAYSIALHEGGHYFGLGHSQDRRAAMFAAYGGGTLSLNQDDRNGICALYPGDGGGSETDCTVTGCPSGEECVDGRCQPEDDGSSSGSFQTCRSCTGHSDCGGPNDLCLGYSSGGYCGKNCSSDAECGSASCVDVGGIRQCVTLGSNGEPDCSGGGSSGSGCRTSSDCPGSEVCNTSTGQCEPPSDDGAALGESCSNDSDCASGLCQATPNGGVCSQTCDWLEPTSCPSGLYCDGDATGACGTGLCMAGSAGSKALGESCSDDTECASLYCDGVCSEPCIPGGAAACQEGYQCQQGAAAGCGSCKQAADMGESCEVNEDCVTRFCARRRSDDSSFCTDTCSSEDDCPAGFACESAGDVSVCAPPKDDGPAPGEVGFECENHADCDSGLCAVDASQDRSFCTRTCEGAGGCPDGFTCESTSGGDQSVCAPSEDDAGSSGAMDGRRRGGGCAVGGLAPGAVPSTMLLLFVIPAIVWVRRRLRRQR